MMNLDELQAEIKEFWVCGICLREFKTKRQLNAHWLWCKEK